MAAIYRIKNPALAQYLREPPADRISSLGDYKRIKSEILTLDLGDPDARDLLEKVTKQFFEKLKKFENGLTPRDIIAADMIKFMKNPAATVSPSDTVVCGIATAGSFAVTAYEVVQRNVVMAGTCGVLTVVLGALTAATALYRLHLRKGLKYKIVKNMRGWHSEHRNQAQKIKIIEAIRDVLEAATARLDEPRPLRPQPPAATDPNSAPSA